MEFHNFSERRPSFNHLYYRSQFSVADLRATSTDRGYLREDNLYSVHRSYFANYPVLLSHFPHRSGGEPEEQADFFLRTISPLNVMDMLLLDIDGGSAITDPEDFVSRWCRFLESRTGKSCIVQVSTPNRNLLTPAVLGDRVVKSPRYGGFHPNWPHDIHQFSPTRNFTNLDISELLERCGG